jgi:phage baseplate assembly protein W
MIYKDMSLYVGTPGVDNLLFDFDAILNAILNFTGTTKGERLFREWIGSTVPNYLFDPLDEETAYNIKYGFLKAIELHESRVKLLMDKTSVVVNLNIEGYDVILTFLVQGLGEVSYQFFLHKKVPFF